MPVLRKSHFGFNLIEIAIVLAVIGLVIGGIYVAASAVTENNRSQSLQKQALSIITNIASVYAGQSNATTLTHQQLQAIGIMPADVTDDGTNFFHSYGGIVTLTTSGGLHSLSFENVPKGACVKFLINSFGTAGSFQNFNLSYIQVNNNTLNLGPSPLTIDFAATYLCTSSLNWVILAIKL